MSEPDVSKHSEDMSYKNLHIGVSGMQGWRMSMEDAHSCMTNFDDKGSSLFGVFDGHGGKEVADYCAQNLHRFLLDSEAYSEGDVKKALKEAFMNIDEALTTEEVIQELKGLQNDMGEEDEDEAALLLEEANMPLGDLLERLKNSAQEQLDNESSEEDKNGDGEKKETNGHDAAGEAKVNGENGEVANQETRKSRKQKKPVKKNPDEIKTDVSVSGGSAPPEDLTVKGVAMNIHEGGAGGSSSSDAVAAVMGTPSTAEMLDGPLDEVDDDPEYQVEDDVEDDEEDDDDDVEGDEDDDEDDFDDDDDEFEDADGFDFQAGSDEVGKDSGTTAIVAVVKGNHLYVANVGDSRCVLCRGGKTVELSTDHKPEDTEELNRIEKAGAKVTENGRVNGGLNLSRALGDHVYKQNKELLPEDQAITANPELQSIELCKEDEFMVLACDGIWNVMTSEEVVKYVKEKLDADEKVPLSKICEELFDLCLAPDTKNNGSGCDNMTCMIVKLKMNDLIKDDDTVAVEKRTLDTPVENGSSKKKMKMNED